MRSIHALTVSFLTLILAVPALAVPVFGEDPGPFADEAPYEADNESVRVLIDPAFHGSTVDVDEPFTFEIATENVAYEPEEATSLPENYANNKRRANAGHFHAYASLLDGTFKETNVFLGANAFTELSEGLLEATMTLPSVGEYLIYVESQYDDHTSRIRPHPQQIGAWDSARVTAVPEPGSIVLMAGGLLLVAGRHGRKRLGRTD